MKRLAQIAAGSAAMFGVAPFMSGTPLYHGAVFATLFVGAMYATALVQHRLHWRNSRRG